MELLKIFSLFCNKIWRGCVSHRRRRETQQISDSPLYHQANRFGPSKTLSHALWLGRMMHMTKAARQKTTDGFQSEVQFNTEPPVWGSANQERPDPLVAVRFWVASRAQDTYF